MRFRSVRWWLVLVLLLAFPFRSPAPFIYRPDTGWTYEPYGSEGKWRKSTAKEQLDLAQAAFDKKDYSLALSASRYLVKHWDLSDYAPQAQYLVGRCYEARGQDERAFKEYQKLLEKQPKIVDYQEILQRQFEIASRYLAGKWFRAFGYIPLYPSMERTAEMFDKIVRTGPYSDVAPQAQLKIGAAREKQKHFELAAKAYELAADRYHDRPKVASEALFRAGLAYHKQAQTAEYDQSAAGQAIAIFSDFIELYPNDARVPEAQKIITALKHEQARGSFATAQFYEKYKRWRGARLYYSEVVQLSQHEPDSALATQAKQRILELEKWLETGKK